MPEEPVTSFFDRLLEDSMHKRIIRLIRDGRDDDEILDTLLSEEGGERHD